MRYYSAILVAAILAASSYGIPDASQAVIEPPTAPWQQYHETRNDPGIGPSYVAYRLDVPGKQSQQLIVYRLFTAHIWADLGPYIENIVKEYYADAAFSQPRGVELCEGLAGSTFSYTADIQHDGHPTVTQEFVAQGTALYAITYRRPLAQPDDDQALRALRSFCPPKDEPLPTPPPFVAPPQYASFSPPASFQMLNGQTQNSFIWYRYSPSGAIALRHQPTLLASITQFGAEERRLAETHAETLDGFRPYTLVANRSSAICAEKPTAGWYTEIRGTYYHTPAVAKQYFFIQDGTLYSVAYLRPAAVSDDMGAVSSMRSFCPRQTETPIPGEPRPSAGANDARISVGGVPLAAPDFVAFYQAMVFGSQMKYDTVWKDANEMPSYGNYVAYAGKTSAGGAILWMRRGIDPGNMSGPEQRQIDRQSQVATLAAALDAGKGGPTLQGFVQRGQSSPEDLTKIAGDLIASMARSSDQTVANSNATQKWVTDHIVPGMTRQRVVALLSGRGIKTRTLDRKLNCGGDNIVTRWWYQGTYPDNQCAVPDSLRRSVTSVDLAGASELGCSFSSYIDVLFNDRDRVQQLVLGNPVSDCL